MSLRLCFKYLFRCKRFESAIHKEYSYRRKEHGYVYKLSITYAASDNLKLIHVNNYLYFSVGKWCLHVHLTQGRHTNLLQFSAR